MVNTHLKMRWSLLSWEMYPKLKLFHRIHSCKHHIILWLSEKRAIFILESRKRNKIHRKAVYDLLRHSFIKYVE